MFMKKWFSRDCNRNICFSRNQEKKNITMPREIYNSNFEPFCILNPILLLRLLSGSRFWVSFQSRVFFFTQLKIYMAINVNIFLVIYFKNKKIIMFF